MIDDAEKNEALSTDDSTKPEAIQLKNSKDQQRMLSPQEAKAIMLEQFVWPVASSAVNGVRLALIVPGGFDIGSVMVKMAGLFGRAIGYTLSIGALGDVLPLRGECIKAFGEELRKVKIQPPPALPGEASEIKLPPLH